MTHPMEEHVIRERAAQNRKREYIRHAWERMTEDQRLRIICELFMQTHLHPLYRLVEAEWEER